jgi:hypothetical protein
MSIITTFPAVPSRLLSIFAAVYDSEDGESKEVLEAYSTPASLAKRGSTEEEESGSKLFADAFKEARRLGIVEGDDGRIRAVKRALESPKSRRVDAEKAFRAVLISVLFNPDLARETEHESFMLAIVWLLGKTPLEPLSFSEPPQDILRADLGEDSQRTELTNLARYQNFLYWARYLGFACFVGFENSTKVVPDPRIAIQSALPQIFSEQKALDIEQFLTALNQQYPVFEGGSAWTAVESMRVQTSNSEDTLSIATSLALRELADRGELVLEAVADARGRILQYGQETERVSRIRRGTIQ